MTDRKEGRKFDKWIFGEGKENIDVEVRTMKDNRHYVNGEDNPNQGKQIFFVEMPEFEIDERGTDPNELQERVFKLLETNAKLQWTPKLYVTVKKEGKGRRGYDRIPYQLNTISVSVDVKAVELSQRANNDKIYRWASKNEEIRRGELKVGIGSQQWREGEDILALVDDTPANREALLQIEIAIDQVGERLKKLLANETIQHTLATVSARNLLATSLEEKASNE